MQKAQPFGGLKGEGISPERGIAFLARGTSIFGAGDKVEEAISQVGGDFHHRSDIGTRELIEEKVRHVQTLKGKRT